MNRLPIACTLSAADLAARRDALGILRTACTEMLSIDDGVSLRFAGDSALLSRLVEVVELERQCCRFLRFLLVVEPDGRAIHLEITGPPGTADFLDAELGLRPEGRSASHSTRNSLSPQFGQIDIYLFDQLLRGRIAPGMRVLDAGCGGGRNLVYLLGQGYDVAATDEDPGAVEAVRALAARLAPHLPGGNFRVEPVEAMSFPESCADVVISSAVLHFARDEAHFDAMMHSMWRVLAPRGLFFCRLASTIGIADRVEHLGGRRFRLPDGSNRHLVDEAILMEWTRRLGGDLIDPIKTTIVQDQRAMTTWVIRKR